MTILGLLNRIFNADQTPNNTVSWSGTNGLKGIQDDIAEEIRARGCVVVPSTTELSAQGKNNSQNAIVQGIGVYTWFPTSAGPENGRLVVQANDGGFWVLQSTGSFLPNANLSLSAPVNGINLYAKGGVLTMTSPLFVPNTSEPATPTGGIVLFAEAGVLKYKNPSGQVKTITVTP